MGASRIVGGVMGLNSIGWKEMGLSRVLGLDSIEWNGSEWGEMRLDRVGLSRVVGSGMGIE